MTAGGPQSSPTTRSHALIAHGTALIAFGLLTVAMTWPMMPQFFSAIPGDSFDGWQNYWNLWWMKLALVHRLQDPFVTDILFAPTGVGLYFHTLNPFNGLATMPVQLAAGLIPAYNTVVVLSWVLGGYGAFLLACYVLRRFGADGVYGPAFLAGVVYTFSPFHMAHLLGHMQVMSLQWIPFYLLYLLRAVDAARTGRAWLRSALLAGVFLILTGLCDWYFVLYLALATPLVMVWGWIKATAARPRPNGLPGRMAGIAAAPLVAAAVFLVGLGPILWPMVQEVRAFSFMVRPATELYILSATLMDFLIPNRLHTLFRPESFAWWGNQIAPVSERTIGIGYLPLVLALVGTWVDRRRAGLWAALAVFFVLMALGPRMQLWTITWAEIPQHAGDDALRGEWSLWAWLNQLAPLVRMSRSVSRYALMVQLAVAVGAAVGLAWLLRHRRLRAWGAAIAVAIVLGEYWVAPYPMSPPDTPDYYRRIDREAPPGAMLNLPMNWDRPGYLLYQTVHQRPLAVAYISRDDPRTATERYPLLQHLRHLGPDILADDPAVVGKQVLADLGIGVVTLDRYKMPGGAERETTEALAASVFGHDKPLFEDHRITVYAVDAPDAPVPYLALGPLHWGPLESSDDRRSPGERWRRLGEQPAGVLIHHAPDHARLAVEFAGDAGAALYLRDPASGVTERYPAEAGERRRIEYPLAGGEGAPFRELELWAPSGELRVLTLGLITD